MNEESELMLHIAGLTGIPLKPYILRNSQTGEIKVNKDPYAIMGDLRMNHQMAIGVDYTSGGFVVNGFFHKSQRRLAEQWAEYMRRKLLGDNITIGGYEYLIKTVRKQSRPDITTQNIMFRVTLSITFERNN